jgi:hypothetical protein
VEKAARIYEVIGHSLVHYADIIEHHHVAILPFVTINKLRLGAEFFQFIN